MGLSTGNSGKNTTFVNFNSKEAAFITGNKDTRKAFPRLSDVTLTRLSVKDDTYEGQAIKKLQLTMDEGADRYIVTFNLAVNAVIQLIGKFLKADLSKPLGLSAELRKEGSTYQRADGTTSEPLKRDMANLSLWQGAYVNLSAGEYPPAVERVLVGTKEYPDDTKRVEWVNAKLEELKAKLSATHGNQGAAGSDDGDFEEPEAGKGPSFDDLGDDIPF